MFCSAAYLPCWPYVPRLPISSILGHQDDLDTSRQAPYSLPALADALDEGPQYPGPERKPEVFTRNRVDSATISRWFACSPVDGTGTPTSDLSHQLLTRFFEHQHRVYPVKRLSREFFLEQELVNLVCRQLEMLFVLRQDPPESRRYRLSTEPYNLQLREKIKAVLAKERLGAVVPSRPCVPAD